MCRQSELLLKSLEKCAIDLQEFIRNFVPCSLLTDIPFHWNPILSVHPWESNSGKLICANHTHKRLIYKLVNHFLIYHGKATRSRNQKNSPDVFKFPHLSVQALPWVQRWKTPFPHPHEFIAWCEGSDNGTWNTSQTMLRRSESGGSCVGRSLSLAGSTPAVRNPNYTLVDVF